MALFGAIKKLFQNTASRSAETVCPASAVMPRFRVKVIEFSDNVEGSSGEIIARQLATREGIEVGYFDEPFNKSFLNLESRTLFDLIDKGQTILDKTGADVLLWGCREGSRIRQSVRRRGAGLCFADGQPLHSGSSRKRKLS